MYKMIKCSIFDFIRVSIEKWFLGINWSFQAVCNVASGIKLLLTSSPRYTFARYRLQAKQAATPLKTGSFQISWVCCETERWQNHENSFAFDFDSTGFVPANRFWRCLQFSPSRQWLDVVRHLQRRIREMSGIIQSCGSWSSWFGTGFRFLLQKNTL